jgi:hypothetical protein
MQAQIQDTYGLLQVPSTTESILLQLMQTMTLSDMNMFASTHMQTALNLFLMMSRMRIQQQPMQMTTKSQMILPTVKQGRGILQISSQRNCQHSQQTSSRTKTNLFLLRVHKPNYFAGTINWDTYLLHTYGFLP